MATFPSYEVTCFKENVSYFSCSCDDAVNLFNLVTDLQLVKHQCSRLGTQLQVPPYQISAWENMYNRNADTILEKIIVFLIANNDNPVEILCSALIDMDHRRLAQRMRNKYEGPQGNATCLLFHFYLITPLLYIFINHKDKVGKSDNSDVHWLSLHPLQQRDMYIYIYIYWW